MARGEFEGETELEVRGGADEAVGGDGEAVPCEEALRGIAVSDDAGETANGARELRDGKEGSVGGAREGIVRESDDGASAPVAGVALEGEDDGEAGGERGVEEVGEGRRWGRRGRAGGGFDLAEDNGEDGVGAGVGEAFGDAREPETSGVGIVTG